MDWRVQENFDIVPDKMNKVHIRFRAASDRIDSYNDQSSTEFTICEGVLHRIPDVIGSYELKVKSFQIYKFCTAPNMEEYVLKGRVMFGYVQTNATMLIEQLCYVGHEISRGWQHNRCLWRM
jgi:hypothetical protein